MWFCDLLVVVDWFGLVRLMFLGYWLLLLDSLICLFIAYDSVGSGFGVCWCLIVICFSLAVCGLLLLALDCVWF